MSISPKIPDPQFVAFTRDGSTAAFRCLVEKHLGAVVATAHRILGVRRDLAEDVAQLVFLRLARKGRSLPEGIVVGAWLHRQTVRLALNAVRGESRRQIREQRAAEIQSIEAMEDQASWEELVPHLDHAILGLPKIDREALALRFHEQAKMREVGERLGLSTAAAEKRVARALEKLRVRLMSRGLTLSVATLGLFLSKYTVGATPPAMAASITAQVALEIPIATSSLVSNTIITMTFMKSLAVGLALGLLVGGVSVARSAKERRQAESARELPVSDAARLTSMSEGGGKRKQVRRGETSAEEIFAQVRELLDQPDHEITRLQLRALLDQLTADQCGPFMALIESSIPPNEKRRVWGDFSRIWGELDPPAALEGLITCEGNSWLRALGAFHAWVDSNPAAAQRWLVENQGRAEFEQAVPSMITAVAVDLVEDSEESVVEWARQLGGDDYREAALAALWKRFTIDAAGDHAADLERLYSTFAKLEDAEFRNLAVRTLGRSWAGARTPEFDHWLEQQAPGEFAYQAAASVVELRWVVQSEEGREVKTLVDIDLLDVTKRALALRGERSQAEALSDLVQRMTVMPAGVAEFALPILDGPSRQLAILHASQLAINANGFHRDRLPPEIALQWAVNLSDPTVREAVIYGQFRKWLETKLWNSIRTPEEFVEDSEWADEIGPILQRAKEEL